MRVSVIIPVHNRKELLVRAVESVLAQDARGFEIIVADDGSTDGMARSIRERFGGSVRIESQDHAGAAAARNLGASVAGGEFVTFLDSDDEVLPDWLSALTSEAERPAGPALIFCGMQEIDERGREGSALLPHPLGPLFHDYTGLFLAGTFTVRRQAFEDVGGYDEELTSSENTELGFRLTDWCAGQNAPTAVIDRVLVRRHLHAGTRLSKDAERYLRGTEKILERHAARLARDPETLAAYHAVAGVRAARLGLKDRMRYHFRQAVAYNPRSAKHLARLLVGGIWPLARLKWRAQQPREAPAALGSIKSP